MTVAAGLKPKARVVATLGSYGWSPKALLDPAARMPGLKAEFLPPVVARGAPRAETFAAVDALAAAIDASLRP
jgi:flavorubredoxin